MQILQRRTLQSTLIIATLPPKHSSINDLGAGPCFVSACPFSWVKQWYAETHVVEDGSEVQQLVHGQVQRRMRRHRTIFTEEQLDALEELFLENQYPDINTREQLAQRTHLREERVEVGYQKFSADEPQ